MVRTSLRQKKPTALEPTSDSVFAPVSETIKGTAAASRSASTETDQVITANLPALINSLIQLAAGVLVLKETANGEPVFRLPPNRLAAEYLINRVLGRPIERTDSSDNQEFEEMLKQQKELKELAVDDLTQLHFKTIGAR